MWLEGVLQLNPALTLSYVSKVFPFRDLQFKRKYIAALRLAGLPE